MKASLTPLPGAPRLALLCSAFALTGLALMPRPAFAQESAGFEAPDAREQRYSTVRPYIAPGQREPQAPSRVARIVQAQGEVRLLDADTRDWEGADRNRVLASGDRLATGRNARAELRIGSTEIRLGERSEFEVLRLDDERIHLLLHKGQLAVRVRSREIAQEIELLTADVRLRPERAGHYRVDRDDNISFATAWRGSLRMVGDNTGFSIGSGQRVEIWQYGGLRYNAAPPLTDAFSDWVARDEQADEAQTASNETRRYVSPEMTGVEELDRHGRWDRHPDFGPVWFPTVVASGWAPFRQGRWVWRVRWGWTWVDAAPWGFAPFHYGRWVNWGGRWAWAPGEFVARPAFAPALVAWVGGPVGGHHGGHGGLSFSISIGGALTPAVGWVALAPWEAYTPAFPCPPRYVTVVNRPHAPPPNRQPVRTGPIMYSNQGVAGAVTVVPRNALSQGQPVAAVAVSSSDAQVQRAIAGERFSSGAAPLRLAVTPQPVITAPAGTTTVAVQPVPGGALPVPNAGTPRAVPLTGPGVTPSGITPVGAAPVSRAPSLPLQSGAPAAAGPAPQPQGRAEWMQRDREAQEQRAAQAREAQSREVQNRVLREGGPVPAREARDIAREIAREAPSGTTTAPVQRAPAAVSLPQAMPQALPTARPSTLPQAVPVPVPAPAAKRDAAQERGREAQPNPPPKPADAPRRPERDRDAKQQHNAVN